tara:strand:- start:42539 stop:43027 length:489 start_codon:yes stop_codon:yes gene_type:complete
MELDASQKQQVAQWAAEGESLSNLQEKISTEFGVKMTYMETRFLIEDLEIDLSVGEPTPEEEETTEEESSGEATEEVVDLEDAGFDGATGSGRVSVSVDKITRPGSVVSGDVTFSDGKTAGWMLDQLGQLRLIPTEEGYQPGQDDIQAFQTALQAELQQQGF